MIPIRDNIPSRTTPYVNYGILAACGLVFLAQVMSGDGGQAIVDTFGMIPARVLGPGGPFRFPNPYGPDLLIVPSVIPEWLTLLTCTFLHGGWLHFLGNMLFLYIFGDNVEDRLGHGGYAAFYLGAGILASAAHLATNPGSPVPTVGASGAIAGVMGAYMLLYPHARVVTVLPLFVFLYLVVLPAPFFLGVWFLMQFFQGVASISRVQTGGVAWWAHIGGFALGFLVAAILRGIDKLKPPVDRLRPGTERNHIHRVHRMYRQRPPY